VISCNKKPIFLGINLDPKQLTCSIIEATPNKKRFKLTGLNTINLKNAEYKNITIFNITKIKEHIHNFITHHKVQTAYTVLSFSGPGFIEKVINLATGVPTYEHLATKNLVIWDYQPIGYTRSTGKTHYYVCGISREKLLQHQLLIHLSNINCIQIIPQHVAILKALATLFPEAWQTSTINNHATLQNFIDYYTDQYDTDALIKTMSIENALNKRTFIQAIGNFLCGATTYERN
jgi:hypothetical protein